ncbi:Sodium-coupled monocarboxylate transporter 2, partial [Armadillidium nasatum]
FKSKNLRVAVFLPIFFKGVVTSAVTLYATTLALEPLTKLDNLTNILLIGIICTIYSSFGGIRAIVWTDVFQLIVMMVGLTTIVTIGIIQNGGFIEMLHTASKGGRMEFFEVIQYNIYGKVIIFSLIFCGGLMAYATYAGCDPMALGLIKKKDQILPFFVMDKLSLIPGLPGLFVATLLGGTLSTISSWLNSCVALIWRDVFLKFDFFKTASPSCATLTNKLTSLLVGAVLTGLAIIASNTNGLIVVITTLYGILTGPPLGVFLIGYFIPKCNLKGAWTGYIVSSALLLWITIGNFLYKNSAELLPFSADECIESNFTSVNITGVREYISSKNSTIENININRSFIVSLYQISSSLYIFFGSLICVLLAVSVSYLTVCNEKIEKISPKLISPCVRKFYWTKEELANFQDNETKNDNYE